GPIVALWTQRGLDRLREKKARRVGLYMTLMRTRATLLAPEHVNALNAIDVVFYGRSGQRIRDAWAEVRKHTEADATAAGWLERMNDLRADLYQVMGAAVGYNFTVDYLKRQVYLPQHFTTMELQGESLRQALVKIVTDEGLKIRLVELPLPPQPPPPPPRPV